MIKLRTLPICKKKLAPQEGGWRICTLRRRLYMEDLWPIFISEGNHVYCVGFVNGDKIVLQYSRPWSLKAKVTSRGARGWKDLLKYHRAVGAPNFAECEIKSDITTLFCLYLADVSDKLDLSSNKRRLEKEKYSFYGVNKSEYVDPRDYENCVLFLDFLSLRDRSLLHARCFWGTLNASLGEMEIISRVESFGCVIA